MKSSLLILATGFLYCLSVNASLTQGGARTTQASMDSTQDVSELERLNAEVSSLFQQGQYDKALAIAERVLVGATQAFGEEDRRVADALSNLGELWLAKKDYNKAEKFNQRALAIYEKTTGSDSVA